jgi:hypothetical protein
MSRGMPLLVESGQNLNFAVPATAITTLLAMTR